MFTQRFQIRYSPYVQGQRVGQSSSQYSLAATHRRNRRARFSDTPAQQALPENRSQKEPGERYSDGDGRCVQLPFPVGFHAQYRSR